MRHPSATDGRFGQLLDLIAVPESHGNYNDWYNQVDQDLAAAGEIPAGSSLPPVLPIVLY